MTVYERPWVKRRITTFKIKFFNTSTYFPGEKLQYGTKNSFMGRAPVTVVSDKLFAFGTRDGMGILIHENSIENAFKEVTKIEVSIVLLFLPKNTYPSKTLIHKNSKKKPKVLKPADGSFADIEKLT